MQIRLACVNKNAIWILNLNFITHKLSTKNEKQQKKCYCALENVGVFIYFLSSLIEVVFSVDLNDLSNYERSLFVLFTASEEQLSNIKQFIALKYRENRNTTIHLIIVSKASWRRNNDYDVINFASVDWIGINQIYSWIEITSHSYCKGNQ